VRIRTRPPGGGTDPGHEIATALRAAYLALHRQTDAWLASLGITADQFVVLAALARGDAETQRNLVGRTASDPSTLRAMLVLLEERGLVRRKPHPTDGRARSVRLTARGRRLFTEAWSATEPLRECLVDAIPPDEIQRLAESLNRIAVFERRAPSPMPEGHRVQARPRPSNETRVKGT
jgi:DNA-binding MarR family transcriptional regulator